MIDPQTSENDRRKPDDNIRSAPVIFALSLDRMAAQK